MISALVATIMSGQPSYGPPSGQGGQGGSGQSGVGYGGYGSGVGKGLIAGGVVAGLLALGFWVVIPLIVWLDKRSNKKKASTVSSTENLEAWDYSSSDRHKSQPQMRDIATGQVHSPDAIYGRQSESGQSEASNFTALPPSPGLRGLGSMMRRKDGATPQGVHPVERAASGGLGSHRSAAPPYSDNAPAQVVELP